MVVFQLATDETRQSQSLRSARVKLRKLHLLEWETLAANQQTVLELVREETAQKYALNNEDRLACIYLKNYQTVRLIKLMTSQIEERARMKERHRQEIALLEQAAEGPGKNSN